MTNLSKKIFITGATHGIGKATSELFCKQGWQVYGISSNPEDERGKIMMKDNKNFIHQTIDITREDEIAKFLQNIAPIDAAFNNAGIGISPQDIDNADIKAAQRVLEVNLLGTMICMKHEIKNMEKGVIINNSSIAAYKAQTGADISYSASKAGILRLTAEAAANPKYRNKVAFFSIIPGYIKTRMTASDKEEKIKSKITDSQMGEPREIAQLVYQIVLNNYAFSSGECFNYNKGAFLI